MNLTNLSRFLRTISAGILLVAAALQPGAAAGGGTPPLPIALVPQPARLIRTSGAFVLGPKTVITVARQPGVAPIGAMLAQRMRVATGYAVPVKTVAANAPARPGAIVLTMAGAGAALGEEGYLLTVAPSGIIIRAPHPAGLFYGTQTLRQLLPVQIESRSIVAGVSWRAPGVRIWDRPRFPVRGLMLDSSRHMQSVAFIKRTLALMAYHKMNTFHWHLTDDVGWRVPIKAYPKLTEVGAWRNEGGHQYGGFYTEAQIRSIVTYAAMRHITIIPEIEMPGHSHAALAAYPFLGCTPGPFDVLRIGQGSVDTMCPGKAGTYKFVEGVLTEIMTLFPSPIIHIGGDETPKVEWRRSPDCQALMQREGIQTLPGLQNYFTRRVVAFLAAHKRRTQGWNEILNGGSLPTNVIVQQWNNPQAAMTAIHEGNDVVVSSTSATYFDYSYATTPLSKVYAFDPMPSGLTLQQARHILGVEACLWTETKPTDASADEYLWPRLIALAEMAWSPPQMRDWQGFKARLLEAHYARLALMGLGAPGADVRDALIARSDFEASR